MGRWDITGNWIDMKKFVLFFAILISVCFAANAQSCKISGSNDGSSILCTGHYLDGNKVAVTLSNDSESTCANVVVKVKVTYKNGSSKEFEGRGKSCPDQEAIIDVYIETTNGSYEWSKYQVTGVSGNKCN